VKETELPFGNSLNQLAGSNPSVTDYVLEMPARCLQCGAGRVGSYSVGTLHILPDSLASEHGRVDVAGGIGNSAFSIRPFWSPDSRSLGFFADGKLKRIGADGGRPARTLHQERHVDEPGIITM
jgi:hypothetical protein